MTDPVTHTKQQSPTGSRYGYAGNDPVNGSDPTGLFGIPGTDWCVDIGDSNCNSIAEQHAGAAQDVADVAGGVLDSVTFGNGNEITSGLGVEDHVDWDSGLTYGGRGLGMAFNLYGAAAGGWVFAGLQFAGSAEATAQACAGGWGVGCGTTAALSVLSLALPYGAGRAARGAGRDMVSWAQGGAGWLTGWAGLTRDQIAHECRW